MSSVSWRDRFGEEATCIRCLQEKDTTDLDRLFWCRECREKGRERAKSRGWIYGGVAGAILALWIWFVIQPSTLILGGWIATVGAAFWLISRISREVHYGVARYRNRRAVEATPPSEAPEDEEGPAEPEADSGSGEEFGPGEPRRNEESR